MSENVLPAPGLILIAPSKVDPQEEQRDSGLLVVHDGGEAQACNLARGVVLACGNEVDEFWNALEIGATVLYHSHGAYPVGENHLTPVNQVAAVVEDQ